MSRWKDPLQRVRVMGVLPYRSYFPPIHLNMEKMDACANGEMHEKKGEKKKRGSEIRQL
jgi:hypothetical protein